MVSSGFLFSFPKSLFAFWFLLPISRLYTLRHRRHHGQVPSVQCRERGQPLRASGAVLLQLLLTACGSQDLCVPLQPHGHVCSERSHRSRLIHYPCLHRHHSQQHLFLRPGMSTRFLHLQLLRPQGSTSSLSSAWHRRRRSKEEGTTAARRRLSDLPSSSGEASIPPTYGSDSTPCEFPFDILFAFLYRAR